MAVELLRDGLEPKGDLGTDSAFLKQCVDVLRTGAKTKDSGIPSSV
jgi:hypothetical protein